MDRKRRWLPWISVVPIAALVLIVALSLNPPPQQPPWVRSGPPHMVHLSLLAPLSVLMLAAVIPLSYYLVSRRLEERIDRNLQALSRMVSKPPAPAERRGQGSTQDMATRFLPPLERQVVDALLAGDGTALQAGLGRLQGMTKLKVHRVVKALAVKGIVTTESYGKTRRVILAKDIREALRT